MQPNKQLKDFSEVELKSFAYDHLANIENSQNAIKAINQELARRANEPKTEAKVEETNG